MNKPTKAQIWSNKFATMTPHEALDFIQKEGRKKMLRNWGIENITRAPHFGAEIYFIEFEFDDESVLAWKGDFPDHYKIDHNGFYVASNAEPDPDEDSPEEREKKEKMN